MGCARSPFASIQHPRKRCDRPRCANAASFVGELQDYSPREGELQPLLNLQNAETSLCVIDFDQDHERAVQVANICNTCCMERPH